MVKRFRKWSRDLEQGCLEELPNIFVNSDFEKEVALSPFRHRAIFILIAIEQIICFLSIPPVE